MLKQLTRLLALAALTLLPLGVRAQTIPVSGYTLAASSGTFTALPGPAATRSGGGADDGYYNGLPLGFTFTFRGQPYTSVSADTNGWLTFGQNITTADGFTNNLTTGSDAQRPLVAPLWDDLGLGSGGVYYATTGTAPTRVFTAEWRNVSWDVAASAPGISFQVKLYEGTNRVQFVYQPASGAVNVSAGASIGLSGPAGDYLSLNNTGTAPTASSSTETSNLATKPAAGQTYTFSPPRPTYDFAPSLNQSASRTYQEVAGTAATRTGGDADDGYYNGLPLGFTFIFRGRPYTTASASTNGWLTFGQDVANSNSAVDNNLTTGGSATRPLVAPLWDDLSLGGGFYYATTGTAPTRVFTAEWRQARWDYHAVSPVISFQVRLFEGSNRVWFVYRPEAGAAYTTSASIGLSDDNGYFLSLNNTGTAPTASSSTETTSLAAKPALNQVYAFAPTGTPDGPLPVQLVAFTARRTAPAAVLLAWTTASEANNAGFGIEKSADAIHWQQLAFVPGVGSSATTRHYGYRDEAAPAAYYRLRQQDLDGTAAYSPVQFVPSAEGAAPTLTLHPNPAPGSAAVQVAGADPAAPLRLLDAPGRPVREYPAGTTALDVQGLPPGLYLLRAGPATHRLVVE